MTLIPFRVTRWRPICLWALALVLCSSTVVTRSWVQAEGQTAVGDKEFPKEVVNWSPYAQNPIFTAEGKGHWDVKIRERGWILREGDTYRLWFTGYDGEKTDRKFLGYATSADGLHWSVWPKNPLVHEHWVEDVNVVKQGDTYYMFAEGEHDNHAELLTSKDGIKWDWHGELKVRSADGKQSAKKPCGTPT